MFRGSVRFAELSPFQEMSLFLFRVLMIYRAFNFKLGVKCAGFLADFKWDTRGNYLPAFLHVRVFCEAFILAGSSCISVPVTSAAAVSEGSVHQLWASKPQGCAAQNAFLPISAACRRAPLAMAEVALALNDPQENH